MVNEVVQAGDDAMKHINNHLQKVLQDYRVSSNSEVKEGEQDLVERVTDAMRKCDPLFAMMFIGNFICGSVRHKLKVDKPDEFDINIKLLLPLTDSNGLQARHVDVVEVSIHYDC
jgi:hypothetical protein